MVWDRGRTNDESRNRDIAPLGPPGTMMEVVAVVVVMHRKIAVVVIQVVVVQVMKGTEESHHKTATQGKMDES